MSDAVPPPERGPGRALVVVGVALVVLGVGLIGGWLLFGRSGSGSVPGAGGTTSSPPTTRGVGGCVGPTSAGSVDSTGGPGSAGGAPAPPPPPMPAGTRYAAGRTPRCGFGEVAIAVTPPRGASSGSSSGPQGFCALLAATEVQQQRGLMEVVDAALGGYDAMAFTFPEPTSIGFWMKDTPLPLSIAYVDASGTVIDVQTMAPCQHSTSCPTYPPPRPYRTAIEVPVPAGGTERLGLVVGAKVHVGGACAPLPR